MDIGKPKKDIEVVPLDVPVEQPEPVKNPNKDKEPVKS